MGKIIVSQNAISKIAAIAAEKCYGVVGLYPIKLGDRFLYFFGKSTPTRGIETRIDNSKVKINLYVIIQGGIKVSEVAQTIIEQVTYEIKKFTHIKDVDVNVIVKGVKREEYAE